MTVDGCSSSKRGRQGCFQSRCQKYDSWPLGLHGGCDRGIEGSPKQSWHCAGHYCHGVHNKHWWPFRVRSAILRGHKMERRASALGTRGGRPLLISCCCTQTCFIKTLEPAVSLIFTDRAKGERQGEGKPFFPFSLFTASNSFKPS